MDTESEKGALQQRIVELEAQLAEQDRTLAELRQLNASLEQRIVLRTRQLEITNKELEAFAYSVSHDLRAPLRHIDGFVELLQKQKAGMLDTQGIHYLDTISNAAQQMQDLIENLLSFSRMAHHELTKTHFDLEPLVREVIQEFSNDTANRNIEWHINPLTRVNGDRAMLRVVLINLLSNAVKYTRQCQTAKIEIGCLSNTPSEQIFYVRDNGVGFDMKYQDRLFGVFQRLHRAEDFEGTGIGLANVRRIINRHGGRTWAESQLNQGAVFYFSLPLAN
jgi:light-regulated signal transduction histidine kinase (bacteriophytochrome)